MSVTASSVEDVAAVCRQVASGSSLVRLSGFDWRVLEVTGHQALLLADQVSGTGPYHQEQADVTWERCGLRQWLNGQFLDSLGQPLASRVLRTKVVNGPNPVCGTPGGEDTEDQLFLLSLEEAVHWLAGQRPPWEEYRNLSYHFGSDKLIAKNEEGDADWWLRSSGFGPDRAAYVRADGYLYVYGSPVSTLSGGVSVLSGGVRPAFWLNLES